jgi:ubiquinone/menaquinone biosynthesis C-methylase UbiE
MRLGEPPPAARMYGDADGYEAYMGGWSSLLAPFFLRFALAEAPGDLLDIGCGTGNLLAAARKMFPDAGLTGVDPSVALLRRLRAYALLADANLTRAVAEALPFRSATFDGVLSLLVLQEFPEPQRALAEMRRVARRGGPVAACQWDFARMPVIAALVDALAEVAPAAALRLRVSPVFASEDKLRQAWLRAGFAEVTVTRLAVLRRFDNFETLWRPLLSGPTPSTLALARLDPSGREAVRTIMQRHLAADEPLMIRAEAFAVRGLA